MSPRLPYELMVSLDFATDKAAFIFLEKLDHQVEWVRVTNQLFFPYGVNFLQQLQNFGYKIFLDIRLSDTPLAMAASILSLRDQPVQRLSVQLTQGLTSLKFAKTAFDLSLPDSHLVATTLLYHLQQPEILPKIFKQTNLDLLYTHVGWALEAKIYYLLCTPYEFPFLFKRFGANFMYMIYASDSASNYERYPFFKMARKGAEIFILGGPCLNHKNPKHYILKIREQIAPAFLTLEQIAHQE